MRVLLRLASVLIAAGLAPTACDRPPSTPPPPQAEVTAEDVGEQLEQAVDTTARYVGQQTETLAQHIDAELNALRARLNEYEARHAGDDDAARREWQSTRAGLEARMNRLDEEAGRLADQADDKVEAARRDLEAGMADLRRAMDNLEH